MANDKVEFDVIVNGKPAKKSLQEIQAELKGVEKKDKTTTSSMKANWVAVGSAVATAAASIGAMAKSAMDVEKATFGLNEETKKYIKNASEMYGLSQEIVAGFVQTGKAAGMGGSAISSMIDQAVALGRAYPHESVETFIDNLSMLNRTGEAQGYIVDILEQKYGAVDLKAISLADKLKTVEEATKGVNSQFNKTKSAKFSSALQGLKNKAVELGEAFNNMLLDSGIIGVLSKITDAAKQMVGYFGVGIDSIAIAFTYLKTVALETMSDVLWSMRDLPAIGDKLREKALALNTEFNVSNDRLDQMKKKLRANVEELKNLNKESKNRSNKETKPVLTNNDISGRTKPVEQKIIEETNAADKKAHDEKKKRLAEIEAYNKKVYSSMSDALMEFVDTGKVNFKSLAASILGDLLRIQVQKQFVGMFGGATAGGGMGGFFASMGLLHTGGSVGGGSNIPSYHTGGSIDSGSNIPSYHTGMRSDERLAKLQVGESVVNRAGTTNNASAIDAMNRGQKVGGGGVILNIENNTSSPIEAEMISSMMKQDSSGREKEVISIIMKNAQTNSSFRNTLKSSIG